MSNAARPQLNPVSPENLTNPVPLYHELRTHEPVYWSDAVHAWFVSRYDDVLACLRDPHLSANRLKLFENQMSALGTDVIRDYMAVSSRQMQMRDGVDHLRLRRQASPGFSPQALDAWRPTIRRTMEMLVDRVLPLRRMNLVKELSYQLPPLVIAELLGIPAQDRGRFQQWAWPMAAFSQPTPGADILTLARQANEATIEMSRYLVGTIEERRHSPGHDVLSRMVQAQQDGQMTLDELVANAIVILSAGHLTTTDQFSNAIHDLLAHPDQFQKLKDDPSLLRSAVEEIIRFNPAVPFTFRIATRDIQLRGRNIRPGDIVFLGLAAANRDPAVFPDPDRFDITRDSVHQKHMSFGFGSHHCLGAGLARRELEIAIEVLLHRIPGLQRDESEVPRLKCHSLLFRGLEALHVKW
ncbi:cytochrome P450 [Archangium violaceum]|uniref:cytochrome P450 n=1 Tax=Archangium violaceum TaxID=83451 RepID=UPI00194DF995|nr:cytochrome P450 [Archangium violaceum]QRN92934.1 cytochrome P450 [Archangium violaceum]